MAQVATQPGLPAQAGSSSSLRRYVHVPETKHDLDWADLVALDLSLYELPGGKQKLAEQLRDAVQHIGFFYITNFGLTPEAIDRQYAIGKELFELYNVFKFTPQYQRSHPSVPSRAPRNTALDSPHSRVSGPSLRSHPSSLTVRSTTTVHPPARTPPATIPPPLYRSAVF